MIRKIAGAVSLVLLSAAISWSVSPVRNATIAPNVNRVITIGVASAAQPPDYVIDGIDDDVQVQQAINDLPPGGGKIVLLGGTYRFSRAVSRAISNVIIEGAGYGTRIISAGTAFSIGAGISNWSIRDMTLDGSTGNSSVLSISGSNNTISGCRVVNANLGISITGGANAVDNCYFDNIATSAIYDNLGGNKITNNYFNYSGDYAIKILGDDIAGGDTVIGNIIQGRAGTGGGIYILPGGGMNLISSNYIGGTSGIGIYIAMNSAQNKIIGNNIRESVVAQVAVAGMKNTISGNVFCGSGSNQDCLLLTATAVTNSITGNTFNAITASGIHLVGAKYNVISGNDFNDMGQATDNMYSSISLDEWGADYSRYNSVTGNVFRQQSSINVKYHVYESPNGDYNLISGNVAGTVAGASNYHKSGAHSVLSADNI